MNGLSPLQPGQDGCPMGLSTGEECRKSAAGCQNTSLWLAASLAARHSKAWSAGGFPFTFSIQPPSRPLRSIRPYRRAPLRRGSKPSLLLCASERFSPGPLSWHQKAAVRRLGLCNMSTSCCKIPSRKAPPPNVMTRCRRFQSPGVSSRWPAPLGTAAPSSKGHLPPLSGPLLQPELSSPW